MKSTQLTARPWVIIPAYNEGTYLDQVLEKVKRVYPYIVVVDDGSHDVTFTIAKRHVDHVLRHTVNLGKGAALKTGCEYAFQQLGATGVIFFDADDQHDPHLLPQFAAALAHHPAVLGVRAFDTQMPLIRIVMNRIASVMTLLLFGKYIPDIPCGYKALSKTAYQQINWQSRDYAVEMEIAARMAQYRIQFEVISIPTVYHDLDRGMTILDTLSIIPQMLKWRLVS